MEYCMGINTRIQFITFNNGKQQRQILEKCSPTKQSFKNSQGINVTFVGR